MATPIWNAYTTLNILPRNRTTRFCVGKCRGWRNARCRWDISHADVQSICNILDNMEMNPPIQALQALPQLAVLSLCTEVHRSYPDQVNDAVADWTVAIQAVSQLYVGRTGFEGQLESLRGELERAKADRDAALHQVDGDTKTIGNLKKIIAKAEAKCKQLESDTTNRAAQESRELEHFRRELERQLTLAESQTAEVKRLKEVIAKLELHLKTARDLKDEVRREYEHCVAVISNLKTEVQQLRDSDYALKAELNTMQTAGKDLEKELKTMNIALDSSKREIEKAHNKYGRYKAKAQQEFASVKTKLDKAEEELRQQQDNKKPIVTVGTHVERNSEESKEIAKLRSQIQELETGIAPSQRHTFKDRLRRIGSTVCCLY